MKLPNFMRKKVNVKRKEWEGGMGIPTRWFIGEASLTKSGEGLPRIAQRQRGELTTNQSVGLVTGEE